MTFALFFGGNDFRLTFLEGLSRPPDGSRQLGDFLRPEEQDAQAHDDGGVSKRKHVFILTPAGREDKEPGGPVFRPPPL